MEFRASLAACALLLCACGATRNPERSPPPAQESAGAQAPAVRESASQPAPRPESGAGPAPEPQSAPLPPSVALVGGRPVTVAELVLHWLQQSPREVRAALEQLVDSHLVEAEAERLGIRLDPERVEQLYLATLADLERNVERNFPGRTLDEWITARLGLAPELYLAGARADVIRHLLAERAVRSFTLANERATVRAVVTGERARAEEALVRAQGGEDFAQIARDLSEDSSAETGGLLPPILRSGSALSRLAFGTGAGGLGGPIREQDSWLVMRVESIETPLRGRWDAVHEAVEASLAERPVQDAEYWQWRAEMLERHDVDLGPFLELTGGGR